MLNKDDLKSLELIKKEEEIKIRESNPKLVAMLAGTSLSNGGREKILDLLDKLYSDLESEVEGLPKQFDVNTSPDKLSSIDAKASIYLCCDVFRHTGGFSFSSKKRQQEAELQEVLNKRAMIAALYLKQVRLFLR